MSRSKQPKPMGSIIEQLLGEDVADGEDLVLPRLVTMSDSEWEKHEARVRREQQRGQQREREQRQARVRDELVRRGLSVRHIELVFRGGLEWTPAMRAVGGEPADEHPPEWFDRGIRVLAGNPGCGKTLAAHAWLLPLAGASDLADAHRVLMTTAAAFARASRYDHGHDSKFEHVARARRLAIDDMGAEYLDDKGSLLVDLDELLDIRWRAGLATVITTNIKASADFRRRYGDRIADRIRDEGGWYAVARASMRGG